MSMWMKRWMGWSLVGVVYSGSWWFHWATIQWNLFWQYTHRSLQTLQNGTNNSTTNNSTNNSTTNNSNSNTNNSNNSNSEQPLIVFRAVTLCHEGTTHTLSPVRLSSNTIVDAAYWHRVISASCPLSSFQCTVTMMDPHLTMVTLTEQHVLTVTHDAWSLGVAVKVKVPPTT